MLAKKRYFQKYGQLVSIKLHNDGSERPNQEAALVEFEDLASALGAVRDPNAVLGNRFIRCVCAMPDASIGLNRSGQWCAANTITAVASTANPLVVCTAYDAVASKANAVACSGQQSKRCGLQ